MNKKIHPYVIGTTVPERWVNKEKGENRPFFELPKFIFAISYG